MKVNQFTKFNVDLSDKSLGKNYRTCEPQPVILQ